MDMARKSYQPSHLHFNTNLLSARVYAYDHFFAAAAAAANSDPNLRLQVLMHISRFDFED